MRVKKGSKKHLIGKGSGAPLIIYQRSDVKSESTWYISMKMNGNPRTYHSIKDCPNEEHARKRALRMYNVRLNKNERILDGIHDVLNCAELLGTWKLLSEELNEFVKTNDRQGAYVYALFPSDGRHEISIINDIFRYIQYGKIGSTGMGKCSQKSLRNRVGYYRAYQNNQHNKARDRPLWMDDVLMPIQEWYISIICINPENPNFQKSSALTMEQICINGAMTHYGKTPYGNLAEKDSRKWPGPPRTLNPIVDGKDPLEEEKIPMPKNRGYQRKDMNDFDPERGYRWVHDDSSNLEKFFRIK